MNEATYEYRGASLRAAIRDLSQIVALQLLEFGEEALNSPALAVGDPIIAVLMLAMTARRNDRLAALIQDGVVEAVGIVGAVGDDLA
ncbi:hypothetical protein ABIE78_002933 [Sinorhizobium fredii]